MKKLLSVLAAALLCTLAYANYPIVRNYSKVSYSAGTQNWCVSFEKEGGCIYFANNSGVLEYDGTNWQTYPIKNYTNVRSVLAENGRIWAGGFNEFGYFSLDSRGVMKYHSETSRLAEDEAMEEIWRIHRRKDEFLLQSNKAVFIYDSTGFKTIDVGAKIDCSALIDETFVAASKEKGILQLNDNIFIPVPGTESLKGKKVNQILNYTEDSMLFVTDSDGVYTYNGEKTQKWDTGIDTELKDNHLFCAAICSTSIAFGTVNGGVFIKSLIDGTICHLNKKTGLQNNTVLSMSFDESGNLWLGLDNGIDCVILNSPERSLFGSDNQYGSGYASLLKGNRLYLGTNQGLFYKDKPMFAHDCNDDGIRPIFGISGQVWSIAEIDGDIFCSNDKGLFILKDNRAVKVPGTDGTWKVDRINGRPDIIIGCSYDGLFRMSKENGKWSSPEMISGFHEASGRFEIDEHGRIWLYHWMKGTFILTLDNDYRSVINVGYCAQHTGFPSDKNNIPNILQQQLVLSSDSGFLYFDDDSSMARPADKLNSLFAVPPRGLTVTETASGDLLFFSGEMDAIAFAGKDGNYTIDSLSLKFLKDEKILGFENVCDLGVGNILINTENGFSTIDTKKIKEHSLTSSEKVFIRGIRVTNSGKDSLIAGSRSHLYEYPKLALPYLCNSLRFDFVCPQYEYDNAMTYSYLLDGYDKGWSEYSGESVKEYTGLPYGNYVFRVRAIDKYNSDISETSVMFSIKPPWYQTKVAYTFYMILLFVLLYAFAQFISTKSKLRIQEIERQKESEIELLKTQTLENNLKHKSQDLASSTMNLIRKNEILLEINNDIEKTLDYLHNDESSKIIRVLNKIQKGIRDNIERDNYWQKFEQNFDIVYNDYLKRLGDRYPSISIGDKRLCAYLKMGLSSKEIAPLLNMSVHSVEMARYRLRKKMALDRSTNLVEFLQHF